MLRVVGMLQVAVPELWPHAVREMASHAIAPSRDGERIERMRFAGAPSRMFASWGFYPDRHRQRFSMP